MMYMTDGVQLETIFGDGSRAQPAGVLDALLGAGKRLLTGESLFMTVFTNTAQGKQRSRLRRPAGKIIPMDLGASAVSSSARRTRSCAPPAACR